eukprot:3024034-Pyramimonas_sp.AAC.1
MVNEAGKGSPQSKSKLESLVKMAEDYRCERKSGPVGFPPDPDSLQHDMFQLTPAVSADPLIDHESNRYRKANGINESFTAEQVTAPLTGGLPMDGGRAYQSIPR